MKFRLLETLEQSLEDIAKDEFGTTTDFREAGFLLRDGSMLDFSGKNQGGRPHKRSLDHRDIGDVYEDTLSTATDYPIDFMNRGNIRLKFEGAGIDISTLNEPTDKQYEVLKRFIKQCIVSEGDFVLDISDDRGNPIVSKWYGDPNNTDDEPLSVTRVIEDIEGYYKK